MLDELEHAKAQVAKITRELGKLSRTQRHQAAMIASQSVPGVGLITAMTFRTEFLEPSRFTESGQVARMMGLAPHVSESGETRREGRLLKSGNSRLRTILVEAALSFLGMGGQKPTPSWGNIIMGGANVLADAPWIATIPGLAIVGVVVSFNLVGDSLRDALDPKLRE